MKVLKVLLLLEFWGHWQQPINFTPFATPLHAVKIIYYWQAKNNKDIFVYHLLLFFQHFRIIAFEKQQKKPKSIPIVVSTYHKPRLQQCIQRMQPTKGTHHWLHSSQRVETHTCHPGKKKSRRPALIICLICMERKKVTEMGWWGGGCL